MTAFLTTHEVAHLLRIKERKVYDMVASGALPVRRVTGKLLFPREEINALLGHQPRLVPVALPAAPERPAIIAGGHDLLLEWALRDSRSGIASFLDGALDGVQRARTGQCIAAGLHIPDGDDWNINTAQEHFGSEDWVLIEWGWRTRGLILREGLPRRPCRLKDCKGLRFQTRQSEAGSELVLDMLLAREGLTRTHLLQSDHAERSETDLAAAIAAGKADIGLGIAAAARAFDLDFVPLIKERFDLLVWRKAYFDPPFQRLLTFSRSKAFAEKAQSLGGYDVSGLGTVRFNGT